MVHRIPVVIRVVVEERNGGGGGRILDAVLCRSNQLAHVVLVLAAVHHLRVVWLGLKTTVDVHVDLRCHALAPLRVDEDDAVGTTGTIEGGSVLQHFHAFYVLWVNACKDIVEEAVVDGGAVELHVEEHTVEHDEWLGIEVQGVQSADEHGGTLSFDACAVDGVNIAGELVLNLTIHAH